MSYFPFFINIQGKRCLVVGGGVVAFRKIEALLPFGVQITVVSPAFCAEMEQMECLCLVRRRFERTDVEGMLFVIGATDEEAVNAEISALCKEKKIPVNIVDDPNKCTFFFPALVKRGELVVGTSSGGTSPLAAQFVRKKIEEVVPEEFASILQLLAYARERAKAEISDSEKRKIVLKQIFSFVMENGMENHTEYGNNIGEEEIEAWIRKEGAK